MNEKNTTETPLKGGVKCYTCSRATMIGLALILVLSLILNVLAFAGGHRGERYSEKGKMKGMDHRMMDHDMGQMESGVPMNQTMSLTMAQMGMMLEGKTGDDLNKAFLEGMIPHHQAAIDMAKYLANSNKSELVQLGGEIITAQTREIEQMQKWLAEWYATNTGTITATP